MRKPHLYNVFIKLSFVVFLLVGLLALAPNHASAAARTSSMSDLPSAQLLHQLQPTGLNTYNSASTISVGKSPAGVAVGDFNKDGKLDLAVVNGLGGTVSVLLGNGDGTFQSPVNYATGVEPYSLVFADFNKDGKTDLATANFRGNSVSILLGNGNGTFQTATSQKAGLNPDGLATGDFNGDGKPDLAVVDSGSSNFRILLGTL